MITVKSLKDDTGTVFSTDVHKELLCLYSPYYAAAIKGKFAESRQDSFTLELNEKRTQLFVEWLYTGRVEVEFWRGTHNDDLHALYVFADQTDIIALRRSIMSYLAIAGRVPPTGRDMTRLVSQLPDSSGLRLFLLEEAQSEWGMREGSNILTEQYWKRCGYVREDFPEDFYDLLLKGYRDSFMPSSNACDYHEHDDKQEWKMSMDIEQAHKLIKLMMCASLRHPFRSTQCVGASCSLLQEWQPLILRRQLLAQRQLRSGIDLSITVGDRQINGDGLRKGKRGSKRC